MIPFRGLAQSLHVCLLGLLAGIPLAAAPPEIERLEPASLQPGRTNFLTLVGKDLGSLDHVWMLDDFVCDILPAESDADGGRQRLLSIVVPEDTPVGATALRVMSPGGVSDLHVIWLEDLPVVPVRGRPHAPESAQEIVPPVAVEGRLTPLHSDFFRLHARAGQVLSVEACAARIGSEADPLVRLLTPSGRELFYMDDAPARGGEVAFRHRFEAEGEYLLEVRDATHRGGRTSTYRLRVADVPLVGLTFPPSLDAAVSSLTLLGPAAAERRPLAQRLIPLAPEGSGWNLNVTVAGSGLRGQAWVPGSPHPCRVESEMGNAPEEADEITLPVRLQGRLREAKDRDWYRLVVDEAHAGRTVEVKARTREFGSPCDVWMEWRNEEGRTLRRLAQDEEATGVMTNRFETAGTYVLLVEELNRRGGEDHVYEVDVRWLEPGFGVAVDADVVALRHGATGKIKVQLDRRGYEGPLRFELTEVPAMLELRNPRAEGGAKEVELEIQLAPQVGPGSLLEFGLVAHAEEGSGWAPRRVGTGPALQKRFREGQAYPPNLEGRILLAVLPAE